MGHRTLVAYDRDGYDLHYAHWGVDPVDITPETPFGTRPDTEWAESCSRGLLDPDGGDLTDDHETDVDPDPLVTGLPFGSVCEHVDPLEHEALFVVDDDFSVRTYLVFALGVDGTGGVGAARGVDAAAGYDRGRPTAALVGYDGATDAAYLRGWLAGARSVRDAGDLDTEAVVRALRWLDPERGAVVWPGRGRDA